jgi:hypothetical protein
MNRGAGTDTLRRRGIHNKQNKMNDTKYDEALALFQQPKPAPTMTAYQLEQQRIHDNLKRLRALRLAREAAGITFKF